MRFINSHRFIDSSLDRFPKNLAKFKCKINCKCLRNNFKYTSDVFQNFKKFKEIIEKGITDRQTVCLSVWSD